MSAFGPGVTCKPSLVQLNENYLRDLTRYTTNGSNDTTVLVEDATYGSVFETTVTNTDNQAGHVYLADGPITFAAGTSFKFAALLNIDGTTPEVAIGFSDGFATADTGIFSNTTATMTSQDSILAYRFSSSAFARGEIRNAGTATESGATSTAWTHALWYKIEVEGECMSDGKLHARFYSTDMSGAVAGRNKYYTIGYDSGVAAVTASGVDNLRFGWATKTTTTTAAILKVKPLVVEYRTIKT